MHALSARYCAYVMHKDHAYVMHKDHKLHTNRRIGILAPASELPTRPSDPAWSCLQLKDLPGGIVVFGGKRRLGPDAEKYTLEQRAKGHTEMVSD